MLLYFTGDGSRIFVKLRSNLSEGCAFSKTNADDAALVLRQMCIVRHENILAFYIFRVPLLNSIRELEKNYFLGIAQISAFTCSEEMPKPANH